MRREGVVMTAVVRNTLFFLTLAGALLVASPSLAVPGALDTTFSSDGKARTNFTAGDDAGNGIAVRPDGTIVVVGGANFDEFAVARYADDGTLDSTFSGNGEVRTDLSSGRDFANGVALQVDGKIVVAGRSGGTGGRFGLVRYNTDGTLDTTFGVDGKVRTNFTAGDDVANGVALQPNGKIVVVGSANFDKFAVARYNDDGTLDSTFSTNGKLVTNFSIVSDWANAVAIQANGKIVAAGTAGSTEFTGTFALVRYNANGTLDSTFGGDGKVRTDFDAEQDVAFGVAIQTNGKIVAAGGGDVSGPTFALARYNTNGTLDTSFSGNGKVRTDFSRGLDAAHGVVVQADGKIVAAGHAGFDTFALARYTAGGALDPTFSGDGKLRTNFSRGHDFANGAALQVDGKIVAAGRVGGRGGRFGLARYLDS
jgi:uncharacterized delta-60 repeat protein